jgi:hypothetical protein
VDDGSCGGLEVEGSRWLLRGFGLRGLGVQLVHLFEPLLQRALGFVGAELGGRGEEAVFGVVGDLGDELGGFFTRVGPGEIEAGDLEAVEEQAGTAGVDVVGGDAAEDFSDGLLDGAPVFRVGEGEAGLAAAAGGGVLDGTAGVVVVVTETLGAFGAADGGAAAAAAVGEDVAALEASGFGLGCEDFGRHVSVPPPWGFLRKI